MSEDDTSGAGKPDAGHPAAECPECAELFELIGEYLDDSETVEMRRELMEHATSCDQCARLLWSMRRLVSTCRTEFGPDVPAEVHVRLWQVLVEEFRVQGEPREGQ